MDEQVRRHLELAAKHLEQAAKADRKYGSSEPDGATRSSVRPTPCAQLRGKAPRTDVQ